ncbi:caspase family protein [Candidatus Cyanaurora vandensis]|uniref:nSTAND1 domain-containing NTPase n=1 Tax=Candidatus Cyanaurora vandensis TaxID=2714958 RepID=UPI00257EE5F6|nr:caspase family protein [Candidatus Cyanaurora vandensis]
MSPVSLGTSRPITTEVSTACFWGLLIGVNDYAAPGLTRLQYCAADCEGLSEALRVATGARQTLFIHHDETLGGATLARVERSLSEIILNAKSQDTVLVYFSGHGVLYQQQVVLCLADTDGADLAETGWEVQRLLARLEQCPAQHKLVWLDACHSGGMRTPLLPLVAALRSQAAQSTGFHALLSCDQDQRSWAFPALGHGLFTYFLIQGLRGAAADERGLIAADGLYRYVYHETLGYLDRLNQQQRFLSYQQARRGAYQPLPEYPLQTPKKIVEMVGELVIATAVPLTPLPCRALVGAEFAEDETALALGQRLNRLGGYALSYWPLGSTPLVQALQEVLKSPVETVFLYLRGQIAGDELVLAGTRLKRAQLVETLAEARTPRYILVLDCPGAVGLGDWIESLRNETQGQALIVQAATTEFAQALLQTLDTGHSGLTASRWLSQLEEQCPGVQTWLTGTQGVIEVLPYTHRNYQPTALDLGICPYMGLRAFTAAQAGFFYGREALVESLLTLVQSQPFLAVVGASGSGKSSLVQAGLMARLRQGKLPRSEQWWVKSMRPGTEPLTALAQLDTTQDFHAWLAQQPTVVLVVDQFEELFTVTPEDQRRLFLNLLLTALASAANFKLVITLRGDHMTSALAVPGLAPYLQQAAVLVPPHLKREEYRAVILQPALRVGLEVEPDLVEVLLEELSTTGGNLPLLEFVLEQLWEARSQGTLTLAAYRQQIGGLRGALERKAEAAYTALDLAARECTRWLLLDLVQLGEGTEDTRRRVPRARLAAPRFPPELVARTLDYLIAAKLVVVGSAGGQNEDGTVEVAHEVLIRSWSTLREWLKENRTLLHNLRRLERASALWQSQGQQPDYLLRGLPLAQAEGLWLQYSDRMSPLEQIFIDRCLAERESEQQVARRRLQEARWLAMALGTLAVMALGLAGVAYWQSLQSQERQVATLVTSAQLRLASSQQLEALVDSVHAEQLVQGIWTAPSNLRTATRHILQEALYTLQQTNRLEGHRNVISGVSFSRDGTLATASWDKTIRLWRPDGRLLREIGQGAAVSSLCFSGDGKTLAAGDAQGRIRLWNLDGTLQRTLQGHRENIWGLSFSPDGKQLVSAGKDQTLRLWTRDGKLLKILTGHRAQVMGVRFSQDGRWIASASWDRTIRLWRRDGTLVKVLQGHREGVWQVAFSPDSQTLASASSDNTLRLWDLTGRKAPQIFVGHDGSVEGVEFSPDGLTLASSSYDKTIRLWSRDGTLLSVLRGHNSLVTSLSFAPRGNLLASGSNDTTVRLWNLAPPWLRTRASHQGSLTDISFQPDSQALTTTSLDKHIHVWRPDGRLLRTITLPVEVLTASLAPDGTLAVGGNDKTLRLWTPDQSLVKIELTESIANLRFSPDGQTLAGAGLGGTVYFWSRTGQPLGSFATETKPLRTLRFSPDGQHLLITSGFDSTLRVWDRQGNLHQRLVGGPRNEFRDATFSPDGQWIIAASLDQTVFLWQRNGKLQTILKGHTDQVTSVSFSPDSQMIASGSNDRTVRLWHPSGQPIAVLHGHNSAIRVITFSPQGKTLVSGDEEGNISFWQDPQTSPRYLLQESCAHLQDYLTYNPKVPLEDRDLCTDFPSQP